MRVLALIFFLSITISVKAEYNGYFIKFTIENVNGQKSIGHVYIAEGYLNKDSLENTNYLKKALDKSEKDWNKRDSLTYYKSRMIYEYLYPYPGNNPKLKYVEYYLTDKTTIPSRAIKNIKILEMIEQSYADGIANELKLSDTIWMKNKPVEVLTIGGFLNSYIIFIHENSPKISEIKKLIEKKKKEINTLNSQYQNREISSDLMDKIDSEVNKIIEKFNDQKVVVIGQYSC